MNKREVDDPEKNRLGTGEISAYKSSDNRTEKFSVILMLSLLASCCFLVPAILFITGGATLAFPYLFYKGMSSTWTVVGLSFLLLFVGLFIFARSRKMKTATCTEGNQDRGKKPTTSNCDGEQKTRGESGERT